jgi:hypothetical protein
MESPEESAIVRLSPPITRMRTKVGTPASCTTMLVTPAPMSTSTWRPCSSGEVSPIARRIAKGLRSTPIGFRPASVATSTCAVTMSR